MRHINFDMDALRSFAAGMEVGSFARAADRLGRSTSAISAQLRKLEQQAGVALTRKSGRGLTLTDGGEAMLSYARRMLELNDEALGAVRGVELEGWVRLGLQEDFGETILPEVLGRFARAHPKVRIEGRVARNKELVEMVAAGRLDLALAWETGAPLAAGERIAALPLVWLSAAANALPWRSGGGEPLPLAALEAPCLLRDIACAHLDRKKISWRLAFVSPSLGGLWAAAGAGLGVALRTPVGLPRSVRVIDPALHGLPKLPTLGLVLHRAEKTLTPLGEHLAAIIVESLRETLPAEWLVSARKPFANSKVRGSSRSTSAAGSTARR